MQVIKNQRICDDEWIVTDTFHADSKKQILTIDVWQENIAQIEGNIEQFGVLLSPDVDLETFVSQFDIDTIALIAIEFPKLADGRGYSLARLLRDRYHYKGDLYASGDVCLDQVWAMHRCGFNVLSMREDQNLESSLAALHPFSVQYQIDSLENLPLYRRR